MYDPNQHKNDNSDLSRGCYFLFAPFSSLPFKNPADSFMGKNYFLYSSYYNVYKNFTYRYYNPPFNPKIKVSVVLNSAETGDLQMHYANGNIFVYYQFIAGGRGTDHLGTYPGIVCVKAAP